MSAEQRARAAPLEDRIKRYCPCGLISLAEAIPRHCSVASCWMPSRFAALVPPLWPRPASLFPLRGVATGSGVGRSLGWSSRYIGWGLPLRLPPRLIVDAEENLLLRLLRVNKSSSHDHFRLDSVESTLPSTQSFHPRVDSAESEMVTSR